MCHEYNVQVPMRTKEVLVQDVLNAAIESLHVLACPKATQEHEAGSEVETAISTTYETKESPWH